MRCSNQWHFSRRRVGHRCRALASDLAIRPTVHTTANTRWATRRGCMRKHRMIIAGIVSGLAAALVLLAIASPAHAQQCQQTVTANVVALDQPFMWNRLGTAQPQGLIFALERDIVPVDNPVDQYGNDLNVNIDPS